MYLYLSFLPAAFNSTLNVGFITTLLKPHPNSIRDFDGTISLFSSILFILKCMVVTLHSWGNNVDNTKGVFILDLIYINAASF